MFVKYFTIFMKLSSAKPLFLLNLSKYMNRVVQHNNMITTNNILINKKNRVVVGNP